MQSWAGEVAFNEEQLAQLQVPLSWREYVISPDFWNRTLQNWQSEFLAVGSMAVLSIYLRQRLTRVQTRRLRAHHHRHRGLRW